MRQEIKSAKLEIMSLDFLIGGDPMIASPPRKRFHMADFQVEDLKFLSELDESANWSEMGLSDVSKQRQLNGLFSSKRREYQTRGC
jgi:hypothetical protein